MTTFQEAEWQEIKRLYVATFKEALKAAKESHAAMSAPEARRLNRHPIYGFGVAVEITWHGRRETYEPLSAGAKSLESGE